MHREKRLASRGGSTGPRRSHTLCLASLLSEPWLRGPPKGQPQIVLRSFLASTNHPTGQMRKPLPRLPSLSVEFPSHPPTAALSLRFPPTPLRLPYPGLLPSQLCCH